MKVPNKISNLKGFRDWVVKNQPKTIEISKDSKLRKIKEFLAENYQSGWGSYRGIKIFYIN